VNGHKSTGTLADLEGEIAALEKRLRSLRSGLGEFTHEARRTGDALERAGGRAPGAEARMKRLEENRKLTERDIRACLDALDTARRRRAELTADSGRHR